MKRWKIDTQGPNADQIAKISALLKAGEVILLPTDTIYGLHADALDREAVERIFEIKKRPAEKSFPVLFASFDQMGKAGVTLPPEVHRVLREIWPAPLTAILRLREPVPASAGELTIAARIPALFWLRRLLEESGPLASTSANLSGQEPLRDPAALPAEIERKIAGIVDAGLFPGKASTIVDFTSGTPDVVRQGEFFFTQKLWKKMRKTL